MRASYIAAVVFVAGLAGPVAPASANLPSDPGASCSTQDSMFCAVDQPARAEGPYYVNFVDEVDGVQQFCQISLVVNRGRTCRTYWPFVNPTVNADQAPASAFNDDRLVATKDEVDGLRGTVAEQKRTIAQRDRTAASQARRIARLEHRIKRLRHRLHH